jgi:NAD-dependent dihydropyrimidine dehydrogenase PreA subunit
LPLLTKELPDSAISYFFLLIQRTARIGKKIVPQRPQQTVFVIPVDEQHASASVVSAKMGWQARHQEGEEKMWEVTVDKDKCTGCEECVNNCPAGVLELVDGKSEPVNIDDCLGCETCVEVCPEDAITVADN